MLGNLNSMPTLCPTDYCMILYSIYSDRITLKRKELSVLNIQNTPCLDNNNGS